MRCGWITDVVSNDCEDADVIYEWYRPWRKYHVVVFVKSFSAECIEFAQYLNNKGVKVIFDINVDYFSTPYGSFFYQGMEPSDQQIANAKQMASLADGIIAASEHIAEKCREYASVRWIPDNIKTSILPQKQAGSLSPNGKIRFLWSGMPQKLADLLLIEKLLLEYSAQFELLLITRHIHLLERCFAPYSERLKKMFDQLNPVIIPFESIEQLLALYAEGGVFLSPRFLDNSYNLGHSEWKVTLPMSVGVPVLCSPVRSYKTLARRAEGGVRVCSTQEEWAESFTHLFQKTLFQKEEHAAARKVVAQYYYTEVVARQHYTFIKGFM
ncbi:MAG: glycosyltransferase family 1 protein [Candidatus Electrothrix sp. EH2]|nr:glycosyltransferase family 1 protein [Candidatus Electrothrix sp. EH2]